MLILLSPSKTIDSEGQFPVIKYSAPEFIEEAEFLAEKIKQLSRNDLADLMSLSEKLSVLNYDYYQHWNTSIQSKRSIPALFFYKGGVYDGLNAIEFNRGQILFANQHLRILSGLYGVLRPLDRVHPYRLEMRTRFALEEGGNLYSFWKDKITASVNYQLQRSQSKLLINLTSTEYFKVIKKKSITGKIITPVFLDQKYGKYKIISTFAKKARGLMARFIIINRLDRVDQLKTFNLEGYQFDPERSQNDKWVFKR